MGTYERLPDHPTDDGESRRRTHNRIREYQAKVPLADRNTLAHVFRTVVNDKWTVREHGIDYDRGTLTLRIIYGPVHGNYPSDVKRVLRDAGVAVFVDVVPIGTEHVDTDEYVCHHKNCNPESNHS